MGRFLNLKCASSRTPVKDCHPSVTEDERTGRFPKSTTTNRLHELLIAVDIVTTPVPNRSVTQTWGGEVKELSENHIKAYRTRMALQTEISLVHSTCESLCPNRHCCICLPFTPYEAWVYSRIKDEKFEPLRGTDHRLLNQRLESYNTHYTRCPAGPGVSQVMAKEQYISLKQSVARAPPTKDLTEEGIEPNPGPPKRGQGKGKGKGKEKEQKPKIDTDKPPTPQEIQNSEKRSLQLQTEILELQAKLHNLKHNEKEEFDLVNHRLTNTISYRDNKLKEAVSDSTKTARFKTAIATELLKLENVKFDLKQAEEKNKPVAVEDVMMPYVIGPVGEDLTANWHVREITKEEIIYNKLMLTNLLDDIDDIHICNIDFRQVSIHAACVHLVRAALPLLAAATTVLFHPTQLQNQCFLGSAHTLMMLNNGYHEFTGQVFTTLSLRASVVMQRGSINADQRPSFDMTEQRQIQDVFELRPYIRMVDVDNKITIIDDPMAYGLDHWTVPTTAMNRWFNQVVSFRSRFVSAQLLNELVNRRTIMAGRDRPEAAATRMSDIIERSSSFSDDWLLRIHNGHSVYEDTRDIALAMVTDQPWTKPQDF